MSSGLAITGTGVWTPSDVLNNEELCESFNAWVGRENERNAAAIAAGQMEALRESSPEFIVKASGIHNRFVFDKAGILDIDVMHPRVPDRPEDQLSIQAEWSVHAAKMALEQAGRTGKDVDMVVLSCANVQRPYPAVAAEVQGELGASGFAYDMLAGCSSTAFPLQLCADTIRAGHAKCALIVNPEFMTGHANFKDRDSHFIFGDAATAIVVERVADATGAGDVWELLDSKLATSYSANIRNNVGYLNRWDPEHRDDPDKLFHQHGRRVFKDVVPWAAEFMAKQLSDLGLAPSELDRYWLHQANSNLNRVIMSRLLGREATLEEAPLIIDNYGNTAAAGSIIAFHKHRADLPSGSRGVICAFGAGYSIGSLIFRKV